jgi:cytochrome c-type biogenesis protein CcmH/NrfG
MAYIIATVPKLATRDFALAGEALDQAEKLAPTNSMTVGITRAIVLFESGKQNEGLALATQVLAYTQSPTDKTNVQSVIRIMEKRKNAEEKKGDQALIKTNAPLEQVSTFSNAMINPNP